MSDRACRKDRSTQQLACTLVEMRLRAKLTQKEVAARMATTQAAIARLESGVQSPSMRTLQSFARANGFCLEIGFVRSSRAVNNTGCMLVLEDAAG